jgi:hypothetical protein
MATAEDLNAQQADMQLYWQLYQLQYFLNRIETNLNLINSSPNAQIVTVVSTNLYKLAAEYYGDAMLWTLIAKANNLTDPQITGAATLIIPPFENQESTGILV